MISKWKELEQDSSLPAGISQQFTDAADRAWLGKLRLPIRLANGKSDWCPTGYQTIACQARYAASVQQRGTGTWRGCTSRQIHLQGHSAFSPSC